jgi:hypothetical protein
MKDKEGLKKSGIVAIGYHPAYKTLEIEFGTGRFYEYSDISQELRDRLCGADDKVEFLFKNIHNVYPYSEVQGAHPLAEVLKELGINAGESDGK